MNRGCPEPSIVSCACKGLIKIWVEWMSEWLNKWVILKGAWGFSDLLNFLLLIQTMCERWINSRLGMSALSGSIGSRQWDVKCTALCENATLYSCWALVWGSPWRLVEFVFRITWHALKATDFKANTKESLCSLSLISWRSERAWGVNLSFFK